MPGIVLDSRGGGPVAGRALVAVIASVAVVMTVAPSGALASRRPASRSCGQVTTRLPKTGSLKVFAVDQVSARRLSCPAARAFVRTWEHLGNTGRLPNAAGGRTIRKVIVYNRWGRPYRLGGFVCRSMTLPGPGPVERVLVKCGSPSGLVTWRESGRFG